MVEDISPKVEMEAAAAGGLGSSFWQSRYVESKSKVTLRLWCSYNGIFITTKNCLFGGNIYLHFDRFFKDTILPIYNKSVKAHSLAELQTLEIFSASIGIAYNEKEVDYSVFPTSYFWLFWNLKIVP